MCSVLGRLACLWEGVFLSSQLLLQGIHLLFWSAIRCKTYPSFFSRYGNGFLVGVRSGSDKDTVARLNDLFSSALYNCSLTHWWPGATLIRVPIPHILVYPSPKRMEVKREGNERIQGGSYPSNRSGEALVFIADLLFCWKICQTSPLKSFTWPPKWSGD